MLNKIRKFEHGKIIIKYNAPVGNPVLWVICSLTLGCIAMRSEIC